MTEVISEESSEESSEEVDKRGSVIGSWQWYSGRHDRGQEEEVPDKRYGNLFGSLFTDRKLKDKRYGLLFGRHFYPRPNTLDKRQPGMYEPIDTDNRKKRQWLHEADRRKKADWLNENEAKRSWLNEAKRYGSLMGRLYSRPRNDKKGSSPDGGPNEEKRYGSLMGRLYSQKNFNNKDK